MKKIFKTLALAVAGALFMASCDDVPAPYNPGGNGGGNEQPGTSVVEATCAQAVELCNALADGATSTETYSITGYITDVFATVSNGQQSFWMADAKDGGKVLQAYWANLPEGVEKFATGSKVKITGKLLKYVNPNTQAVVAEVKNATVEILEDGGGDQPDPSVVEATCAQAVELCNALADGATSIETYSITGYITDVFATVSKGQQSFWMADIKDGGKVLQAYWANLPEGVEKFTAGSKVKITGKLLKYVNPTTQAVVAEVKNATVEILEQGGDTPDQPGDVLQVDCARALAAAQALADGATSEETYAVTGYITKIIGTVSRNQQSFWMADEKGDAEVFQAYWANLPEGVTEFTVGSKVTITGQIIKYIDKEGNMVPEIKNATVTILEAGGDTPGGDTPTPGEKTDYSIDLPYTLGENAYDCEAVINSVEGCQTVKIGTAKAAGTFTVNMPAGKHTFYAVAWKGITTANVTFSNGDTLVKTVPVNGNEGATGNPTFTLTVTDDDKYEIELAEDATLTVTSDKRIIFFGIK